VGFLKALICISQCGAIKWEATIRLMKRGDEKSVGRQVLDEH
jgi:hypothetical protein